MKAFSWFSDMFKSRKDEDQDSTPVLEVGNVPNWEPVMENTNVREEDYERTVPVFEIPEWDPNVPEIPSPVPSYDRYALAEELPAWEPDVPAMPVELPEPLAPVTSWAQPEAPVTEVPSWIPEIPAEDYERTVAVFEIPEWEPDVPEKVPSVPVAPAVQWPEPEDPVMEIPSRIPESPAEDDERTAAAFEVPAWEPELLPMVHWPEPVDPMPEEILMAAVPVTNLPQPEESAEAYERTVPSFAIPEWEADVPAIPVESDQQSEDAVVEIPAQISSAPVDDYERTVPVFEVPEWEPEPVPGSDPEMTVFSGSARQPVSAAPLEDEKTRPVMETEPEQKSAVTEEVWPITGRDTLRPPAYMEAEEKPVPKEPAAVIKPVQKPESVKAAPPVAAKLPEQPAPAPRKATSIPVKPKPATPTVVDMKTPEVPDFGRSISSETCDFSVRQQWNWLGRLHEVIPTLRMGTEPACVDYPLTLRNMEAAGDMRITVKRVAMGIGTLLSITNLENAITCEDISKLREAAQILTAYGKMVNGRQADAIRMTVRYLGVRVAELQMR